MAYERRKTVMKNTTVRVSERQHKIWSDEVKSGGYSSLGEFIRTSVDKSMQKGIITPNEIQELMSVLNGLYTELHSIGINLNQLTRHANSTGRIQQNIDTNLAEMSEINSDIIDSLAVLANSKFRRLSRRNDH